MNLKSLRLDGTQVTDAGMAHLKGLYRLAHLDVRRTRVTAAGTNQLKTPLPFLSAAH